MTGEGDAPRCAADRERVDDAARLDPYFFDLDVDPIITSKTPGPGMDILQASANNLYAGVTMKDLEGCDAGDAEFDRLIGSLMAEIREHVADEEQNLFPKLRAA